MGGYADDVTMSVTDIYGRRILNQKFSGVSNLNTGSLSSGVYMVTIADKNGKIIKQDKIVKE